MIKLIRQLLQKFADDIDSGSCEMSSEEQFKLISILSSLADKDQRISKQSACEYLGVCRATFDNYIRDGFIPKGRKDDGFKELSWSKLDLDLFIANNKAGLAKS